MILNSKILLSLTKSRLAISVVFSALAGYIIASDDIDFLNRLILIVNVKKIKSDSKKISIKSIFGNENALIDKFINSNTMLNLSLIHI